MALTDRTVSIALSPAKGSDQLAALALIAKATPAARAKVCPAGYKGKAKKLFIDKGVMVRQTLAVASTTPDLSTPAKTTRTNKENTDMTKTADKPARTTRSRKGKADTATTRTAKRDAAVSAPKVDEAITAASVARDHSLDGRRFRAFLRDNDIRKGSFPQDKRSITRLVKGFVKAEAARTAA